MLQVIGWTDNEASVRVDFFKPSGKWYTTEAVIWTGSYAHGLVQEEFIKSLRDHFAKTPDRLGDMDAICLEPYHKNSYPLCIKAGGWREKRD